MWRKGSAEQGTGQGAVAKQALATCSFSKLSEVLRCAQSCDVHTGPLELLPPPSSSTPSPQHLPPSVKVLPLFSWYHSSWDTEPNLEHPHFVQAEKVGGAYGEDVDDHKHYNIKVICCIAYSPIHWHLLYCDLSCSLSTRSGLTSVCVLGHPPL